MPLGRRTVRLEVESTAGPKVIEISFVVVPCLRKTLLSVPRLVATGHNVLFQHSGKAQINRDGIALNLILENGMFLLPTKVPLSPAKGGTLKDISSVRFAAPLESGAGDLGPIPEEGAEEVLREEGDDEAQRPVGLRIPYSPSAKEVREHSLTHCPFRDWCKHCVSGKSRDANCSHGFRDPNRVPLVQMDYAFLRGDSDDDEKITVLLAILFDLLPGCTP